MGGLWDDVRHTLRSEADPEYREEQRRIDAIRARFMAFYASFVYGAFWGLDYVVYPQRAVAFGLLRGGVVAGGLVVLVLSTVRSRPWHAGAARFLGIAGTAMIPIMCALTEGFASQYVVGIIICFIAHTTLEIYRPARLALWLGAIIVLYAVLNAVTHPDTPAPNVASSLSFLAGSYLFCLIASGLLEFQRRSLFRTRQALSARNRDLDATIRTLRETQTRLVEGEKLSALGRLIASLSHEINNPVNVLQNNLAPLEEYFRKIEAVLSVARNEGDVPGAWVENDLDFVLADTADALATMNEGVQRIRAVHQEMRAFVRGDAPEIWEGDVNEGLRATVNMFRRSLPRAMPIEVACCALPPIRFQPGQMNQVFFNLIQNAVDAIEGAGGSGTIAIRTEIDGAWVRITVEDTGPGVSALAREHLFEPFFTTKAPGKGTGLGLATSYQIVQRHQGRIGLDESYRAGARFMVWLPRQP
jgi:signal transduction histidine kinase